MFEANIAPPLVEVEGERVGFSGESIESESDSVPETACWEVATPGPKCFYKIPWMGRDEKKRIVMSAYAIEMDEVKTENAFGGTSIGHRSGVVCRIVFVLTLGCLGVE